jgi:hypothetical protein
MAGIPTPELYRGEVEELEYRCELDKKCEWWVSRPCSVALQSLPLQSPGNNWGNAKPLVAVGGRRPAYPNCNSSPLSSRFNLVVSYLKPSLLGQPQGTVPPPMHLEIRAGDEGAVSRIARVIWTPQGWDDFADVVQVSGLLVSRWEVWGWAELAPNDPDFPLPYKAEFHMLLDRHGGGDVNVFVNPLANVTTDMS